MAPMPVLPVFQVQQGLEQLVLLVELLALVLVQRELLGRVRTPVPLHLLERVQLLERIQLLEQVQLPQPALVLQAPEQARFLQLAVPLRLALVPQGPAQEPLRPLVQGRLVDFQVVLGLALALQPVWLHLLEPLALLQLLLVDHRRFLAQ